MTDTLDAEESMIMGELMMYDALAPVGIDSPASSLVTSPVLCCKAGVVEEEEKELTVQNCEGADYFVNRDFALL